MWKIVDGVKQGALADWDLSKDLDLPPPEGQTGLLTERTVCYSSFHTALRV